MNNSKRYYLVSPEEYLALKDSQMKQREPSDIELSKYNQNLMQDKMAEKTESAKSWKQFSNNLKPILTESLVEASSATPSQSVSSSNSSNPISPASLSDYDQMIDSLQSSVSPNYISKATRLFNLLNEIEGIDITPKTMTVNGQKMFGLPVTNISQLVKPTKYLSFNLTPLLKKIKDQPEIVKLISNKQAKEQLKGLKMAMPPALLESSDRLNGDKRGVDDNFEPSLFDEQVGSAPPTKKKRKKKISWQTLF